jgi:hypothetical protein
MTESPASDAVQIVAATLGYETHMALRLTQAEAHPAQAVADAEHAGNLSAAVRALLAEALAARTTTVPANRRNM